MLPNAEMESELNNRSPRTGVHAIKRPITSTRAQQTLTPRTAQRPVQPPIQQPLKPGKQPIGHSISQPAGWQ